MTPVALLRDGLVLPLVVAVVLARALGGPLSGPASWRRRAGWLVSTAVAGWMAWGLPAPLTGAGPLVAADRLWFAAPAFALLAAPRALPAAAGAPLRALVLVGLAWWAFEARRRWAWDPAQTAGVLLGCGLGGALAWSAATAAARHPRPPWALGLLGAWLAAVAGALLATGSLSYGLRVAPLATTVLALAALSTQGVGRGLAVAVTATAAPLALGMLGLAPAFSSMPLGLAVGLAALPVAALGLARRGGAPPAPAVP